MDLEAPPARLAGTVVEADSGRPLGDVQVRIEDDGGGVRFVNMATTDSSGRFAFEDLEPKRYRVSFQKPAYQVETRELAAAEESDLRVEMRRGEGIALEARDGIFAMPLRGLFVRALDATGQAAFAGSVSLDSEGRGEVPSLKPGVYELRAESSGYAPVRLTGVAVPSQTITLVLTPGGSLEIRVGPQTLALPQATARLLGADGRVYMWSAFTTRRDDPSRLARAPDRERGARPLRPRGRGRGAAGRGGPRGSAERRRAALNRRPRMRDEQQLFEEINRALPPGVDWKAGAGRYVRELVARGGPSFRQWHLTKPFLGEPLAGEPLHGDASRPAVDPDVTYHELFAFLNVVRAADPPPGARVLDVGCGPGWTSHYLGKMGYTVLGFDLSEEMLELARERVDAEPFPPYPRQRLDVRFVRHDIEAAPLGEQAGEPYDLALVDSVLHHFLDPVAALRHLARASARGRSWPSSRRSSGGGPLDPANRAIMERYRTIERPYTASQLADILRLAGSPTTRSSSA